MKEFMQKIMNANLSDPNRVVNQRILTLEKYNKNDKCYARAE